MDGAVLFARTPVIGLVLLTTEIAILPDRGWAWALLAVGVLIALTGLGGSARVEKSQLSARDRAH